MYVAKFTPQAVDDIRSLSKNTRTSLKKEFEKTILKDPSGCSEDLTEPLAGFRSFHFREYRIVYRLYEDLNAIAVVGVGKKTSDPNSDVYKRLESLASSGKLADTVLRTLRLLSSP